MTHGFRALAGIFMVCMAVSGCGPSPIPTVKLAGTVTLDGKPLSQSLLLLYPAEKDGASPVATPITSGRYSADVVPQGKYRAAFRSATTPEGYGEPATSVDSSFAAPTEKDRAKRDPIPEKYLLPTVAVDAMADNLDLNFELSSK